MIQRTLLKKKDPPRQWWITDGVLERADAASASNSIVADVTGEGNPVIPDGVKEIGEGAFQECHSLTHITIPTSATGRWDNMFSQCGNLSSVVYPTSLRNVPEDIRAMMCIGFIPNQHRYPEELHAEYIGHIREHGEKFMDAAIDVLENWEES